MHRLLFPYVTDPNCISHLLDFALAHYLYSVIDLLCLSGCVSVSVTLLTIMLSVDKVMERQGQ